jgi:hypothetical protein
MRTFWSVSGWDGACQAHRTGEPSRNLSRRPIHRGENRQAPVNHLCSAANRSRHFVYAVDAEVGCSRHYPQCHARSAIVYGGYNNAPCAPPRGPDGTCMAKRHSSRANSTGKTITPFSVSSEYLGASINTPRISALGTMRALECTPYVMRTMLFAQPVGIHYGDDDPLLRSQSRGQARRPSTPDDLGLLGLWCVAV